MARSMASEGSSVVRCKDELLSILNANWQTEIEGHYTYKTPSDKERDPWRP
jgi:hypothetical protein